MDKKYRWGILGCGKIAQKFANSLALVKDAELTAVASSDPLRAETFAKTNGVKLWYGSYNELVKNEDVDIVYIATTHNFHYANALLAIEHGKAVLCEKPFTINAKEASGLIKKARAKKAFLMEAMWTRFFPVTRQVIQLINDGVIGDILQVRADFCFSFPYDPGNRLFNPALGGGALLDVGVYPISYAFMLLGQDPVEFSSMATVGPTGVDHQSSYLLRYRSGTLAILGASAEMDTRNEAWIYGSKGYIHVPLFYKPKTLHLHLRNGKTETFDMPYESTGYQFEIRSVMDCLSRGETENELMPLDETKNIMELMDTFRKSWGVKYPGDS